ncbi:DNA-binding transcriptional regulator of glucitol operon [Corynebacterium timonense]|uniref:DNA-binding transcriptional regulator of glucitol operon n=2 Tax=Corynebacterium timonense TaxID=441500 RepID=A0A1H1LK73_9CORY|nr:hypothetical protein [Corynebacterium timonense]SDR74269.1 DNA-binding transcriptional regulator of glucitol operon [Corynebacterium timonense]
MDAQPGTKPGSAAGTATHPPQRQRIRVRAWHIVLLVLAVICTFLLAWWQWTRFQSGSGTFQNLGYALQWPIFGAFFVYAYRMGIRMENEKIDAHNSGASMQELYEADQARFGGAETTTSIDDDFLPARPTLDVEEFNALNVQRRGQGDGPEESRQ